MEIDMNAYDPIMEEIYAIRRRISARYGHDIHRYVAAMRELHKDDEAKGIKYAHLSSARVAPAPAMDGKNLSLVDCPTEPFNKVAAEMRQG